MPQFTTFCTMAVSACLGLSAKSTADDFFFTAACGEGSGLFACCLVNPPNGTGCVFNKEGDPFAFLFQNNWGAVECGACPAASEFPGAGDCVHFGSHSASLSGGVAAIFDCITSDPGGDLTITSTSVNTINDFGMTTLILNFAAASSSGIMTVDNFNWLNTLTSGVTVQEFCFGNVLLAGLASQTFIRKSPC